MDPDALGRTLTEHVSAFDRLAALRGLAEAATDGATVEEITGAASAFLAGDAVVALDPAGARYSTTELLELEGRVLAEATSGQQAGIAVVGPAALGGAMRARLARVPEQGRQPADLVKLLAALLPSRARVGRSRLPGARPEAYKRRPRHRRGRASEAIQTRMGHSSINVTLDRYGHLFPELDEAIAVGFGERLVEVRRLRAAG